MAVHTRSKAEACDPDQLSDIMIEKVEGKSRKVMRRKCDGMLEDPTLPPHSSQNTDRDKR